MPVGYSPPPKLALVLNHLRALGTINEYLNSAVGMARDVTELFNHVTRELNNSVLKPAGWEPFHRETGYLYSFPADGRWRVVRGDQIGICIYPTPPLGDEDDDDPSVNLYVPAKWKLLKKFAAQLKAPPGFDHIRDYPGYNDDCPTFRYVRYAECLGSDGKFNQAKFFKAFADATATLVALEGTIDKVIDRLQRRS